jgi:hypothetical protein
MSPGHSPEALLLLVHVLLFLKAIIAALILIAGILSECQWNSA